MHSACVNVTASKAIGEADFFTLAPPFLHGDQKWETEGHVIAAAMLRNVQLFVLFQEVTPVFVRICLDAFLFRIGGVCQDLPEGWDTMVRDFLDYMPARLDHYEKMVMQNSILKRRSVGIGRYDLAEALDWGVTGPGLRATGSDWDLRKKRPYGGYDQFEFEVPIAQGGDSYDRCRVRVDEIRESLRIIRQCLDNMPSGPYKATHAQTTPPPKERTMQDIETLIHHFLNVSWGPVVPPSECSVAVEATKGMNSYYLVSDGGGMSYRTRIRTPSFPHLQMIPLLSNGFMIADLIVIVASIDFVMADVDR